jgi:hypothetical protein
MGWFSADGIMGRKVSARRRSTPRTGAHRQCLKVEQLEARTLLTGIWTPLASLAPEGIATMLLLSDGTVLSLASVEENPGRNWYRLTPDRSGSYVNGTWSQLASMHDTRVYFPSNVLRDGRVFVAGGEYGGGTNTGEVYDPLANTWTRTPNGPLGDIGDVPSEILPDGRLIVGYRFTGQTSFYDPASNTWSPGPMKDDRADEESWVLMADQTIVNVEVFNIPRAEKYIPSQNRWVSAGTLPVNLIAGSELGAGLRLPDGRAFFLGASGQTALYTPGPNPTDPGSWVAGPQIPNNQGTWDAPAAMMPNGKVLCAVGPRSYNGPTALYEFDPVTNAFTSVASPTFSGPPYVGRMLMLPNGQVLWSNGNSLLYVYTPDGAPDPSWQPAIAGITTNADGSYRLSGTQLNGLSEGAAYGDDAEMSSNYPLVRLVAAHDQVYYARTSNWSSTGVATGNTPVSTDFTLPAGIPTGAYSLSVVANGIASDSVTFVVPPIGHSIEAVPVQGGIVPGPDVSSPAGTNTADTTLSAMVDPGRLGSFPVEGNLPNRSARVRGSEVSSQPATRTAGGTDGVHELADPFGEWTWWG